MSKRVTVSRVNDRALVRVSRTPGSCSRKAPMSIQRAGLRSVLVAAIATLLLPAAITGASATAPSVGAVAVDPSDPLTIYAGTTAGVYKTTDGGEQWMLIAAQLQGVHTLLIDPTMPATLVAGVGARGVFRST